MAIDPVTHIKLKCRDPRTGEFLDNFKSKTWRVRIVDENGLARWIRMTPMNTKVANPNHDHAIHQPDDVENPRWLTLV